MICDELNKFVIVFLIDLLIMDVVDILGVFSKLFPVFLRVNSFTSYALDEMIHVNIIFED